ncbi:MAG: hypothetical protein HOP11_07490 [Saprospiraceae bacterium]|nr:hypothetical protein [Saprospiraceae bacterium]
MLGLIGKNINDHENRIAHCTVRPDTIERINLQPWCVTAEAQGAKDGPPKKLVWRPANEDDFQYFLKLQGDTKNPLVGVLPDHIAKEKKKMFDAAMVEYNNLMGNATKVAESK